MEMRQEHKPFEVKDGGTLYKIGMFAAMNHITVKTLRSVSYTHLRAHET